MFFFFVSTTTFDVHFQGGWAVLQAQELHVAAVAHESVAVDGFVSVPNANGEESGLVLDGGRNHGILGVAVAGEDAAVWVLGQKLHLEVPPY
jgi:hypothetical protein